MVLPPWRYLDVMQLPTGNNQKSNPGTHRLLQAAKPADLIEETTNIPRISTDTSSDKTISMTSRKAPPSGSAHLNIRKRFWNVGRLLHEQPQSWGSALAEGSTLRNSGGRRGLTREVIVQRFHDEQLISIRIEALQFCMNLSRAAA